jgi:RND family efflux transporter MFP subunit
MIFHKRVIQRMRFHYVIALIAVLALGAVGVFFYFKPQPLVKVQKAFRGPVSEFVYASGIVEPIQLAKVVPLQRRRILDLCRCEGQMVVKGQILGRQDDTEEREVLKQLEIRFQQLVRDLNRAEKDKAPKAEIEQKDTAVREARSGINAQNSRLETLVIRAPMDGMVLRRDGEVGEIAGPGDVLFWVGKPSPLQVAAEINEEDVTKIKVGQTALLSSEAFEHRPLRARVSHITPKGDPTKKTFRVYLGLPDGSQLRIGMTVEANIVFREKPSAVVVPIDSIFAGVVQVVRDGVVRRVPVTTGIRGSRLVEIVNGVSAGASVVSPARPELADGEKVRAEVTPRQEPEETTKVAAGTEESRPPVGWPGKQGAEHETMVDPEISAALSANVQSLVNDARRSALRSPAGSNP